LLILPGLSRIQADNVTTILNPYLLNLEGRGVVSRFSFRTDFSKATPTGEDFFPDLFHPAHPGAKDIRNLSFFQLLQGLGTDHAAIRYHTELTNLKALPDSPQSQCRLHGKVFKYGGVSEPLAVSYKVGLKLFSLKLASICFL
jgi:hypothetical protein